MKAERRWRPTSVLGQLSPATPNLELEDEIRWETGLALIAGLDEAGRGAIAGPVVAAAVILPLDRTDLADVLRGVNDSKLLTARQRSILFERILEHALATGVGSASAVEIDELGIVAANGRAMQAALRQLQPAAQYLLVDGRQRLKRVSQPQRAVVQGDGLSLSIAAASILAKVSRDRLMVALDAQFPGYGFARHKGYCTEAHVAALERLGPCPAHRRSFAPLRRPML